MRLLTLLIFLPAFAWAQNYEDLAKRASERPDTAKVRLLIQHAKEAFNSDPDLSRKLSETALEISIASKDKNGEAASLLEISRVFTRQGNFAKSVELSSQAEAIFKSLNDKKGIADVLNARGLTFSLEGKYPQSLGDFTSALKIVQELDNKQAMASTIENIGMVHFRQGDHQTALQYFKDSYQVYVGQGNEAAAAKVLVNLGATYNRLKMPDEALKAHSQSLEYFEKSNNQTGIGIANNNIGSVYYELGDFNKAIERYTRSLEVKRKMNDKRGTAVSLKNISEAYIQLNQFAKAKDNAEQSLKIAEEIHSREQLKDAYEMLSMIYEKLRDYEKALSYERKMAEQKDSMFSADKTSQISRMRAIYETDKAENEARVTKIQADSEISQRDQQRNFFIVLALLFLIAAVLAFYLFRQKNKSNKLLSGKNVIIEKALQEREILLREIHHRVKNNLQIISSLLSLQSRSLPDSGAQDAINESRNRVKSMSLIHEQLYQEDNTSGVDMRDYIQRLVSSLVSSYGVSPEKIEVRVDADEILLDVDSAIPLGLILNELISNSMKYAFPGPRSGAITISLKDMMKELRLVVQDNGVGYDPDKKETKSFGLNMVNSLMRKLRAEMSVVSNSGTSVELTIRDFKRLNLLKT
jgi:two-component system, sensor histidine kinase PdtaS